jgi:hypothetical protein
LAEVVFGEATFEITGAVGAAAPSVGFCEEARSASAFA